MTRVIAAIVVAVGIAVGGVVLVGRGGSDDQQVQSSTSSTLSRRDQREADSARAWSKQVIAAYTPMVNRSPELIKGAREWVEGTRPSDQFREELDLALVEFVRARDDIASIAPYAKARHALDLFARGAQLYLEFARIYRAAVDVPAGDARSQLDTLARRVRELGDRVYDRGTAAMAPYVHDDPLRDVDVRLPEEVPNWAEEGMAPGPPLDDPPPAAAESPPLRAKTRPEQPKAKWLADVRAAEIPTAGDLAAAIETGDPERLRPVARGFVDAAERLRGTPDPKGGREESARARLSLLVSADAARGAQAAAVVEGDSAARLQAVSRRLALIGDGLWPPGLGVRSTGFDGGLLSGHD